ncbi:MAG: L-2-amino-thiazoline-4-carboxylic acid hydrolase [Erysipelotrichaceae bacterium]|jgi:hypothetical protein
MKYKAVYWIILKPFVRKYLKKHFDKKSIKTIFKNAKMEYKNLLNKADDIGSDNPMASNLYFALLFLSFLTGNREKFTEDMLADMMDNILNSPVLKKMSRIDLNNDDDMSKLKNRMSRSAEWADKNKDRYPETWEFNFEDKHKDGCYYYFTKCPIAKFFKDNHMEDLTHLFCELDYIMIKSRHGKLIRNFTLANGDDVCDFWIVGDKVENPE